MPGNENPITRRAMLTRLAATLAALSIPGTALAQTPSQPPRRKVAVTIDDGPASGAGSDLELFVRISDALREAFVAEKVPAIMFVNERQLNVDGQRDARVGVLKRWIDAGLEVGNHTYSHPNLGQVTLARYLDDIVQGEVISRLLLEAQGKKLTWFRYPFLASGHGDAAKTVEDFLAERGYRIAPVSVDYQDYRFAGIYARHLRAGNRQQAEAQFAAMMETLDASFARAEQRSTEVLGYELAQTLLIHCNELNADTLRRSLVRIRDRGYSFVSLDDAMEDPAYKLGGIRPGGLGGGGLFESLAAAKRANGSRS